MSSRMNFRQIGAAVVIIAVIALVLSPMIARLRAHKQQAEPVCISNLRKCGIAIKLYMDDYDTNIPPTGETAQKILANQPTCCPNDTEWTKGCTQAYGAPLIGSYAYTRAVPGWRTAPMKDVAQFYTSSTSPYTMMVDIFHGSDGVPAKYHGEPPIEYYKNNKDGNYHIPSTYYCLKSDGHVECIHPKRPERELFTWNAVFSFSGEIAQKYLKISSFEQRNQNLQKGR